VKTIVTVALAAVALAGCVTTQEQITQMQREDAAACRGTRGTYNDCIRNRMTYRQMVQQKEEREAKEFGDAIERASRTTTQAMNPPQPVAPLRTTRCYTISGVTNCQTY